MDSLKKPLRECSIFDLTDDQKLIDSILGMPGVTESSYLEMAAKESVIIAMFTLAEETGDKKLLERLQAEFSSDLESFFNE